MHKGCVVILVDNKKRDLMVASLIAHQLRRLDILCHLEPLEAYRGVLEAHRPDLILFNHLTGSHLVRYSKKLQAMGVLTAVLPNEGILYNREVLLYNSGKYHSGAHIDHFFCWQQDHKEALVESGFDDTQIHVVGIPRFDFYFSPWSHTLPRSAFRETGKPKLLVCTNFVLAKWRDLPKIDADRLFAPWKDRIPSYRDYHQAIETNHQSRQKVYDYLNVLANSRRYQLVVKPHPAEDVSVYQLWWLGLAPEIRREVTVVPDGNITPLILACDLEISCETCTTALESWIAGKPTIELLFSRMPLFFHEEVAALNVLCEDPNQLLEQVEQQLAHPEQSAFQAQRQAHLARWCDAPQGNSSAKMAGIIAEALANRPPVLWNQLTLSDYRRGWKLRLLKALGEPYSYPFFLTLKSLLFAKRYQLKRQIYKKTITPKDVATARARLESVVS